jgi:hypothetical protein
MESYIGSMLSVEGACALSIVLRGLRCVLRVRFGARLGARELGPGQILLTPSLPPGTDAFERRAVRTLDRPYLLVQGEL